MQILVTFLLLLGCKLETTHPFDSNPMQVGATTVFDSDAERVASKTVGATSCTPTVNEGTRHRSGMKNRKIINPPDAKTITFAEILKWSAPTGSDDTKIRSVDRPIDDRETTVWSLDAYVQLAKLSADDCDIHMELSADSVDGDRFVVEIPYGESFINARQVITMALGRAPSSSGIKPQGLKIRVVGYGFYDSSHWSEHDPIRGHNHGSAAVASLWELHPVFKIDILGAGLKRVNTKHK